VAPYLRSHCRDLVPGAGIVFAPAPSRGPAITRDGGCWSSVWTSPAQVASRTCASC